jgi:CheY-like chemotaxis protein
MDNNGKPLILLVDDDNNFREIVRAKFESAGFAIEEAKDGAEGVEKAKAKKPNLILLDVQMPKMNGVVVLSKLKADPEMAGIKVLFLTNYGENNTADQPLDDKFAKDAGAAGHIKKTDDLDDIVSRVRSELGLV